MDLLVRRGLTQLTEQTHWHRLLVVLVLYNDNQMVSSQGLLV